MFTFGPQPPPDVFQTQANTQFNSFMNPLNPANMNPGWGMNPNYLTPSFDAPYRPQYSGAQPYGYYGRPGFFQSINHLFNPIARDTPRWENAVDYNRPYVDSASTRPYDAGMWGMQRILAPAIAFGAAGRLLGGGALGISGGGIGGYMGSTIGRGLFGGIAQGMGMGATASGWAGAVGGGLGSFIGGAALSYAGGALLMEGANRAVFNPYMNTRLSTQDLRRNFAGVNFADASGDVVTGGSLSRTEAARMASQITRAGIQDMSFSTGEYRSISDLSARAGLADNVSSRQLVQRFKDVASQVKLLMAIAKDPDISHAIEELSKLNLAGADITGGRNSVAGQAYSSLGRFAAQAGTSIQRLMNTVGAQGQYLFQANGMTPYLGQLAAANTYAGFSAAYRTGLISPAQMARMGGVEGATQSSLTGMINAAQTPYNMMGMYNQFFGGARGGAAGGNVVNTLTSFAQAVGQNPFLVMGRQQLYGNIMAGNQVSREGTEGLKRQLLSIADSMPGVFKKKNGHYDIESLVPIMSGMMGLSQDQIMGVVQQMAAEQDPTTARQRVVGNDRYAAEQMRAYISQEGLYNGWIGRGWQGIRHAGRDVTEQFANMFALPMARWAAGAGDTLEQTADSWQFGSTIGHGLKLDNSNELFGGSTKSVQTFAHRVNMPSWLRKGLEYTGDAPGDIPLYAHINKLATEDKDPDAIAFLNTKDRSTQRRLLGKMLRNNPQLFGDDTKRLLNSGKAMDLALDDISKADRVTYDFKSPQGMRGNLVKNLAEVTGQSSDDINAQLQSAGAIEQLATAIGSGKVDSSSIDDYLNQKGNEGLKAQLTEASGGKTGGALYDYVKKGYLAIAQTGVGSLAEAAYSKHYDLDTLKKNGGQGLPEELRKKFLSAKTDDERKNILAQADLAANQNTLYDNKILGAEGMDFDQAFNLNQIQVNARKASNQIQSALQSGRIDFGTAISTLAQLDSNTTFAKSVDKFDKAVDRINGNDGKQDTNFKTSEVGRLLSWFQNKPEDTSNVAGSKGSNTGQH